MGKNVFIKICAVLCAVLMLVSCKSEPVTESATTSAQAQTELNKPVIITPEFRLGYNADDSLDPFKAESAANCAVTRLIFDSLFICDSGFEPQTVLAAKYEYIGEVITVSLRQGVIFSDGSSFTSADVSYSYSLAKNSSVYSDRLSGIAYLTVVDEYTVKFVVNGDNPYIVSCLDFPIVKKNSASSPVGSGRYRYVEDANGKYLMLNNKYKLNKNDGFGVIELCDMSTVDTVSYKVQNGELDFAFDNLSSGKQPNINTSNMAVPLNNMVFVGMNSESELLKLKSVRNAVSSAIDTESVTNKVYGNFAKATDLPFHPDWYAGDDNYNFEKKSTLEYLSSIGYNKLNDEGFATNGWYTITLTLIVNKENEQRTKLADEVAQSLIASGINVNVVKYSFKEYLSALEEKNYDLYIGEVKLTNDMNLSDVFGGYVYYQTTNEFGIDRENESRAAYKSFLSGEISLKEFSDVFMRSTPFVPICFRSGAAIFSRSLGGTSQMFSGDIFYGISEWTMP